MARGAILATKKENVNWHCVPSPYGQPICHPCCSMPSYHTIEDFQLDLPHLHDCKLRTRLKSIWLERL